MTPQDGAPSLKVFSGPGSGSSVPLDPIETRIGSDATCQLQIPGVSPVCARLRQEAEGYVLYDAQGAGGVFVNDDRVNGRAVLRDGDILWLGTPGDPASVMIQCRVGMPSPVVAPAEFVMDPVPSAGTGDFVVPSGDEDAFFVDDSTPPPPPPASRAEEPFFMADDVASTETFAAPAPTFVPPAAPAWEPPAPAAPGPGIAPAPPPPSPVTAAPPPIPPSPVPPPPFPPPLPPALASPAPAPAPAPPAAAAPAPAPPPSAPTPAAPRPAPSPAASKGAASIVRPRSSVPVPPARSGGRPGAVPSRRPVKSGPPRIVFIIGGAALLIGAIVVGAFLLRGSPVLTAVTPDRARPGDTIVLTGENFSSTPAQNEVVFGDVPGEVAEASPTQLKVVVPSMRLVPGQDTPISLKVRRGGRESAARDLTVFQAPKVARLSPEVAMPGEEISIEGTGWRDNATVRFGAQPAEIVTSSSSLLRVRVPAVEGAPGTTVPVVVTVGGADSSPVEFIIGQLPLVLGLEPARATLGDMVKIKGKGFSAEPAANRVRIGGLPALVASAAENELHVVVPRVPAAPGEAGLPVEIEVVSRPIVGSATLTVVGPPDPLELRFIAEPFTDPGGHDHAALATELGPAFVLSAAEGKSAAQRATEAQAALNDAVARLRASLDEQIETRNLATTPTIGLKGRPNALLTVTAEDAAAYNEGWLKPEPKSTPVTRARLAAWWEAITRDLVLMMLRGRAPELTPELGAEGRALAQLYDRARKTGKFGLPREVVAALKPAEAETLRAIGLRVPAAVFVKEDRSAAPGAAAAAAAAQGIKLEGTWTGWEMEQGRKRGITLSVQGEAGTLTFAGSVAISVPLLRVEQPQKGIVKFSALIRGGGRHYDGRWDGEKITGTITQEGIAPVQVGTFELTR
jgi:hypothetical protein